MVIDGMGVLEALLLAEHSFSPFDVLWFSLTSTPSLVPGLSLFYWFGYDGRADVYRRVVLRTHVSHFPLFQAPFYYFSLFWLRLCPCCLLFR